MTETPSETSRAATNEPACESWIYAEPDRYESKLCSAADEMFDAMFTDLSSRHSGYTANVK